MKLINKTLLFARNYEKEALKEIDAELRPDFHMTPCVGWTNDPNGFSYYKGEYHLFYQSNPYDVKWDSMHWGHVVSKDLLHWEYCPCALAPDKPYDAFGCFSGSAIETKDGKHLIIYTGVRKEEGEYAKDIQTQCIAVGDGMNYTKYEQNPVLDAGSIPKGLSPNDFRDPKIWMETDGSFRCVVGARKPEKEGSILLFKSADGFQWEFESVLIENDGRFGTMWECPDFFELNGKKVLICSPMEMLPEGLEYHNGYGTLCLIGELDETTKKFSYEHNQTVDYGIDFYAPQTLLTPDGRRIMIGWMQNWACCDETGAKERGWFGQMTLPRELSIENGRLIQKPVRELNQYRSNEIIHKDVVVTQKTSLPGVAGRVLDLEIEIQPEGEEMYHKFVMNIAENEDFHTELSYRPFESVLKIDRKYSGSRKSFVHQRRCQIPYDNGKIKLRVILDKYSVEVFINDGNQAMTTVIMTDLTATGISFSTEGVAKMNVTKYDLFAGE